MADDLPPGVRRLRDPIAAAKSAKNDDVVDTYPIGAGPKTMLNPIPYIAKFFGYTWLYPASKLKDMILSMKSPTSSKRHHYHQKYNRVPDIWECSTDDPICIYEAEIQFKRDKLVDASILEIIQQQMDLCTNQHPLSAADSCKDIIDEFWAMKKNFHVKYADLGTHQNARTALNKQKNRFIESRYKERMGMERNDDWIIHDYARHKATE